MRGMKWSWLIVNQDYNLYTKGFTLLKHVKTRKGVAVISKTQGNILRYFFLTTTKDNFSVSYVSKQLKYIKNE